MVTWRLHGPGPLMPPPPEGETTHLYELAVAAVQTRQGHPELYYPAVTIDGHVRMIDGDTGYLTIDAACDAARPVQAQLKKLAAVVGMETYDDISIVLDDLIRGTA